MMSLNRFFLYICLFFILFFGYIFYAETTSDYRVSHDAWFYILIAIVVFSIIFSYEKLLRINSKFMFFFTMMFFWSLAFYVNSYKLLRLQVEWTDIFVAFSIYLIPILSFLPTAFFYRPRSDTYFSKIDLGFIVPVVCVLFIIAISISIYEMSVTGIVPILMNNISDSRLEFSLPFLHVVGEALLKLSFYISMYLLVFCNYKKSNIFVIIGTILYFLVVFSRSGLMEIGIFTIIIFSIKNKASFLALKKRKVVFLLALIFSFSVLGAIRQGGSFNINEYTDSKINNQAINWFYGYYFVNMDNLGISIVNDKVVFDYKRSFLFMSQILGTKPTQAEINQYTYMGKLNLGTGFRDFSLDWGLYLGGGMLSILICIYVFLMNGIKSDLSLLYKALFLTYIVLFPMVNRFSGFIPFFIFISLFCIDLILSKKR